MNKVKISKVTLKNWDNFFLSEEEQLNRAKAVSSGSMTSKAIPEAYRLKPSMIAGLVGYTDNSFQKVITTTGKIISTREWKKNYKVFQQDLGLRSTLAERAAKTQITKLKKRAMELAEQDRLKELEEIKELEEYIIHCKAGFKYNLWNISFEDLPTLKVSIRRKSMWISYEEKGFKYDKVIAKYRDGWVSLEEFLGWFEDERFLMYKPKLPEILGVIT